MELLGDETVIWRGRPSWRAFIGWFALWIPVALLPAIIAGAVKASDREPWGGYSRWLIVSLFLVAIVVIYDALRRASTRFLVTDKRIHIRRGILARRERSTHLDRVQNVNTHQSLLQRAFAVGTVDFDTAGTDPDESNFAFAGIANPHGLVSALQPYLARAHGANAPR